MNLKIRKIIITGILILLSIIMINTNVEARSLFGFGNQVKAAARGAPVDISSADVIDGEPGNNTFCVYVKEDLFPLAVYDVVNYIHIDGLTSTIYENNKGAELAKYTNKENGVLAWILAQGDPGCYPYQRNYSDKQKAIYGFFGTWLDANGLVFTSRGEEYKKEDWVQKGYEYAKEYETSGKASIEDNLANIPEDKPGIDTNTPQIDNIIIDNEDYIKIGPLNWVYYGQLQSIDIYNQNNDKISAKYGKYVGNKLEAFDNIGDIKSGQDFYILLKLDEKTSEISKIQAKVIHQKQNIKADIWTLSRNYGVDNQNLITTDSKVEIETTTAELTIGKISLIGDLNVIKVNKDNTAIKLAGVEFVIKKTDTNKYVKQENGKITYVDNEKDATIFTTDKEGKIHIQNLIVGNYTAYEKSNPNYGYEINKDGIPLKVTVNKTDVTQIANKQKFIKLSGYVWNDIIYGKTSERNDLFKDNSFDDKDKLMSGISVKLKDKSGDVIKDKDGNEFIAKTDDSGAYLFKDVLIDELSNYYIEFEYDGLVYTNVIPHIKLNNGSKSAEAIKAREDFNFNFSLVENKEGNVGQTRDGNGKIAHDNLEYIKNAAEYKSTLDHTKSVYNITANTNETGFNIREHFTYGMEEIKHINLGLYEREQPDVAVIKDIQNARLTINGFEHTYNYESRFKNAGEYEKGFNVGIKFKNERGTQSYTRPIYKSDTDYTNPESASKQLNVYVTYKIRVVNESTQRKITANSVVDYYDSGYEIEKVGTGIDDQGRVIGELKHTDTAYNGEYKKTIINTTAKIEPQAYTDIYVQFKMNSETVKGVLAQKEPLNNIVEIHSYSVFDENGKITAGIDKDSAPGNARPGEEATYEDDTDKAPTFILENAGERTMGGVVFEDNAISSGIGKVRQGDGKYEGEHGIEGIKVIFREVGSSGGRETTTDIDGNYGFTAFVPGNYEIVYEWGGQTYTNQATKEITTYSVQNYKGTIFNRDAHQGNQWYKQLNPRYSDATDDYNTRLQIDQELKDVVYGNREDPKYTINTIKSTTPTMTFEIENKNDDEDESGEEKEDKFIPYEIKNVDFGIIERAIQEITINKSVDTIKLTLANGTILNDAKIVEENGVKKLVGTTAGIVYLAPSQTTVPKNGIIKIELDNELIQGSTLEAGYKITATNISELDYISEEFYKYGVINGKVVTINPAAIVDYLDKDWGYDQEKNAKEGWTEKTLDEIRKLEKDGKKIFDAKLYSEGSNINNTRILYTEKLKNANLEPTTSDSVMLNVSKILSTAEEIELNNETEIVNITKDGGGELEEIPGNHVPGNTPEEKDSATSETITVTPPTGESLNYNIYIIAGIAALIGLGIGVIIIKKKALK